MNKSVYIKPELVKKISDSQGYNNVRSFSEMLRIIIESYYKKNNKNDVVLNMPDDLYEQIWIECDNDFEVPSKIIEKLAKEYDMEEA